MIETLSKMSGTTHVSYRDSKTVTKDVTSFLKMMATEGKVSYTVTTVERPVLSYNDFNTIPPCNSIVFRAGDQPIWNRNETALPMSWRLFKNTIVNPGKEYTLQTIPSLSTAKDFDVKQNQPNFTTMFEKRINQTVAAQKAMAYYKTVYDMTDDDIQRIDPDVYSDSIMEMVSQMLNPETDMTKREEKADKEVLNVEPKTITVAKNAIKSDDVEKVAAQDPRIQKVKAAEKKIYACNTLSRSDLVSPAGQVIHAYDLQISAAYTSMWQKFNQDDKFRVDDKHDLVSRDGKVKYIEHVDMSGVRQDLERAAEDSKRIHNAKDPTLGTNRGERMDYIIHDEFIKLLCSYESDWPFCGGDFAIYMSRAIVNGTE